MKMDYDIFISYRREGGDTMAQLLYDRLERDGFHPFMDVEQMRSGKFNEQLYDRIAECKAFLLIQPEGALDRCRDPEDWVRKEIQEALRLGKTIVPFMMRNFVFPEDLPEEISEVAFFQGVTASDSRYFDETYRQTVRLLEDAISNTQLPAEPVKQRPEGLRAIAADYWHRFLHGVGTGILAIVCGAIGFFLVSLAAYGLNALLCWILGLFMAEVPLVNPELGFWQKIFFGGIGMALFLVCLILAHEADSVPKIFFSLLLGIGVIVLYQYLKPLLLLLLAGAIVLIGLFGPISDGSDGKKT